MIFGFNTDVRVGDHVFHVQTEDRGAQNPVLDTTIYFRGRVLAKRGTSYEDFLKSSDFSEIKLREMLEQQHKDLLEAVRSGALPELKAIEGGKRPALTVQLLNPGNFLRGTMGIVQVAVKRAEGEEPVEGANVKVALRTGNPQPHEFAQPTNAEGKAEVQFPVPHLGAAGAELIIEASSGEGTAELKYAIRPRMKTA